MVLVYTQEKSGRPTLAIIGAAGMLVVSVAMALGVVAARRAVPDTVLGKPLALGSWPIQIRCPEGWAALGGMDSTSGFIFLERASRSAPRQLEISRSGPYQLLPPSLYVSPESLSRLGNEGSFRDLGPRPLGRLPGAAVVIGRRAIQIGVAPDGFVYRLMLDSPTGVRPADIKLLEDVADSIEIIDPLITDDPSDLWEACSFRFEAPAGTLFAQDADPDPDTIVCYGDPGGEGSWFVEARLTFLAAGRSAADLVRDRVATRNLGLEPDKIEQSEQDGLAWARAIVESSDEPRFCQSVSVRTLASGMALMLLGTADENTRRSLAEVEEHILRSAAYTGETPNLDAELSRGRDLARQVREDVANQWSRRDQTSWFTAYRANSRMPFGFTRVIRRAGTRKGVDGFYFDQSHYYEYGSQSAVRSRGVTFVPFDGQPAFTVYRGDQKESSRNARWDLVEQSSGAGGEIQIEWSRDDHKQVTREIRPGDAFLPDPLPEWAYFLIASGARSDDQYLLSSSAHPFAHDAYWLRAARIPGVEGLAMRVTQDFDPEVQEWYFDSGGNLREARFGETRRILSCGPQDVYAGFRNARRVLSEVDSWWREP